MNNIVEWGFLYWCYFQGYFCTSAEEGCVLSCPEGELILIDPRYKLFLINPRLDAILIDTKLEPILQDFRKMDFLIDLRIVEVFFDRKINSKVMKSILWDCLFIYFGCWHRTKRRNGSSVLDYQCVNRTTHGGICPGKMNTGKFQLFSGTKEMVWVALSVFLVDLQTTVNKLNESVFTLSISLNKYTKIY